MILGSEAASSSMYVCTRIILYGVNAMLLSAPDGELLGIRVEWRIKPQYFGCQFTTLRVELNDNEVGKTSASRTHLKISARIVIILSATDNTRQD